MSNQVNKKNEELINPSRYYGGPKAYASGYQPSVLKWLQEREVYHTEQIALHKKNLKETEFLIQAYKEQFSEEISDSGHIISDVKDFGLELNNIFGNSDSGNDRSSWKKTALYVIEQRDILLQSSEIISLSGIILSPSGISNAKVYLSTGLKELCDEKKLKRYKKSGIKGFYYGLPYMFEGDNPKEQYFLKLFK